MLDYDRMRTLEIEGGDPQIPISIAPSLTVLHGKRREVSPGGKYAKVSRVWAYARESARKHPRG